MSERVTIRFLLWVYLLLLGFIVVITIAIFFMYGSIATSTKDMINLDAHKAAVETFSGVAQSFADLIKVTVGAVIGALGATLQSILSKKATDNDIPDLEKQDESPKGKKQKVSLGKSEGESETKN